MIDEKERQEIIEEAINKSVEKTLLMLPEVIGNLMQSHAALHRINAKFYGDHPEFKDHKDVVAAVVEGVEGKHPTLEHQEILDRAVPEIRRRIALMSKLDMTRVTSTPERKLENLEIGDPQRLKPFGEI